jgi:transcriptional regulator with XRE-family HTH domain
MATIKERRKALGLGRKQLSAYAYVDPRTAQLIEMGMNADADCIDRLEKTLDALEAGEQPPDWKDAVDAKIAAEGHHRFSAETQSQSGSDGGSANEPGGEA